MSSPLAFDSGTVTTMMAAVTPLVNLGAQWVKQHHWFKNSWIVPLAPVFGGMLVLIGLFSAGDIGIHLSGTASFLSGDWIVVYSNLLGGLFGGASSLVTYNVQKQVGQKIGVTLLPPGPDNPSDTAAQNVQNAVPVVEEVMAKQ